MRYNGPMNGASGNVIFGALALGVGMLLPLQAAMNANMNKHMGHPLWAGVWNFVVGLAILLVIAAVMGAKPNGPGAIFSSAPLWAVWGGACGASLVVVALLSAPRLGAALLMACLVAGQLLSSLMFDHMGWLGYAQRPLSLGRIGGAVLLGLGVWMIRRF